MHPVHADTNRQRTAPPQAHGAPLCLGHTRIQSVHTCTCFRTWAVSFPARNVNVLFHSYGQSPRESMPLKFSSAGQPQTQSCWCSQVTNYFVMQHPMPAPHGLLLRLEGVGDAIPAPSNEAATLSPSTHNCSMPHIRPFAPQPTARRSPGLSGGCHSGMGSGGCACASGAPWESPAHQQCACNTA